MSRKTVKKFLGPEFYKKYPLFDVERQYNETLESCVFSNHAFVPHSVPELEEEDIFITIESLTYELSYKLIDEGISHYKTSESLFFKVLSAKETCAIRMNPPIPKEFEENLFSTDVQKLYESLDDKEKIYLKLWKNSWKQQILTSSLVIVGKPTGLSNAVVLYVHEPTSLSKYDYMRAAAINNRGRNKSSAYFPQREFDELIERVDGTNIQKREYAEISEMVDQSKRCERDECLTEDFFSFGRDKETHLIWTNPHTSPLLGVKDEESAKKYFQYRKWYRKKLGKNMGGKRF